MIVSDLDLVHHRAEIAGGLIVVEQLMFTPAEFIFADLKIVSYSKEEEQELTRIGILADIPRDYGRVQD